MIYTDTGHFVGYKIELFFIHEMNDLSKFSRTKYEDPQAIDFYVFLINATERRILDELLRRKFSVDWSINNFTYFK